MQRQFRLKQSADFARLRQHGRTYRHKLLLMSVLPNDCEHNRYGFITGKRLGKAVQRNRVRRLMRETVRLCHPELRTGFDVVLVAHPPVVGQPLAAVQAAVHDLFRQAGLSALSQD